MVMKYDMNSKWNVNHIIIRLDSLTPGPSCLTYNIIWFGAIRLFKSCHHCNKPPSCYGNLLPQSFLCIAPLHLHLPPIAFRAIGLLSIIWGQSFIPTLYVIPAPRFSFCLPVVKRETLWGNTGSKHASSSHSTTHHPRSWNSKSF